MKLEGGVDVKMRDTVASLRASVAQIHSPRSDGRQGSMDAPLLSQLGLSPSVVSGRIIELEGPYSLLIFVIAQLSAQGLSVAVVGYPQLNMAAIKHCGGHMDSIIVIQQPGADRIAISTVLADGVDVVITNLEGACVTPRRASVLAARLRSSGRLFIAGHGRCAGSLARVETVSYEARGLQRGQGHIHALSARVCCNSARFAPRAVDISFTAQGMRVDIAEEELRRSA